MMNEGKVIREAAQETGQDVFLTSPEVAKRWRMTRGALSQWRVRGHGPRFMQLGTGEGTVLYRLADVVAWEEEHTYTLSRRRGRPPAGQLRRGPAGEPGHGA